MLFKLFWPHRLITAIMLLFTIWSIESFMMNSVRADQVIHRSGQLFMITSSNCPWCEAFEEEVGKSYSRTEESKILPLRRHDFYAKMPSDLVHITPAIMTPTFIILRNELEVGRIVGYPGAELFWWRLSEFLH